MLTWFDKNCYSVSSHSNAYSRDTIDVYLLCKYAFITWFDSHCYPTSGSGHVHSQHAENVYLPGEHILTSRFDGNIYFTSSSGSVCFKHAEKKSTFHVGSPLLLGLVVTVTLGVVPDDVHSDLTETVHLPCEHTFIAGFDSNSALPAMPAKYIQSVL